jgi:Rps23 Pro-64 3,4-dihydroxylase Tpa1-like proline 4-hydroxylase
MKDNGCLFFELDDNDKEILKSLRDEYLNYGNIICASFKYLHNDLNFNLNISPGVTSYANFSSLFDDIVEWRRVQDEIDSITNMNSYLYDARCEVGGDFTSLHPLLENIYNTSYSTEEKIITTADGSCSQNLKFDINGRIMIAKMLLSTHRDGSKYGEGKIIKRPCTIIIYTNEDWKPGDGGELVVDGEVLEPTLGNAALLDYTNGKDVEHGVNPVLTDFVRKSFTIFVEKKEFIKND